MFCPLENLKSFCSTLQSFSDICFCKNGCVFANHMFENLTNHERYTPLYFIFKITTRIIDIVWNTIMTCVVIASNRLIPTSQSLMFYD